MELQQGAVVVGIDGTDKDARALSWAADEAASRAVSLHLVWGFDLATAGYGHTLATVDVDSVGGDLFERAAARVRELHPELPITWAIVTDSAATALVAASRQARLVVVGARGLGRIAGRLLGSVSQKVAAHAHCPVVIARGSAMPRGPVVVGIDPLDIHAPMLEFAVDHARRHGTTVRLVHAWQPQVPGDEPTVRRAMAESARIRRKELAAVAEEWRVRTEVEIETDLVERHPVEALTDEGATASLLVLGSRGRRGLTGVRLGSVAFGTLHETPLVAIIPIGHDEP